MTTFIKAAATTASAVALLGSLALSAPVMAEEAPSRAELGKEIAWDRGLGNCLACHAMEDGNLPGTIGPPLIAMKARFPDRDALYEIVYDIWERTPNTIMPRFGKYGVLSEEQVDLVVDYLYTL
ncbi:MAG: sulfur oxidation c-type cytochrome SoxX [Halothiobacillaceae bacterium]